MSYQFGTAAIRSAISLPSLPVIPEMAGDVLRLGWSSHAPTIGIHWRHHWMDGGDTLLSLGEDAGETWLRVPGYVDVLIAPGRGDLLVSPEASGLDPATLEHLLVDQILPRVLASRGNTLVHASAVSIHGRNILLLGPSGRGKSTLAAMLRRHGHAIHSDDCAQLIVGNEGIAAVPTYPSLRLNADSLDALFPGQSETAPVASYSDKRRIPIAGAAHAAPLEVSAVYLLGDPRDAGDAVAITPLASREFCMSLIRHSFRLELAERTESTRQLANCAAIARRLPGFRLDYPRDYRMETVLVQSIAEHLARLPSPPAMPVST